MKTKAKHLVSHVWVVIEWRPDAWIHGVHDNEEYARDQANKHIGKQMENFYQGGANVITNKFSVLKLPVQGPNTINSKFESKAWWGYGEQRKQPNKKLYINKNLTPQLANLYREADDDIQNYVNYQGVF